MKKDLKNNLTFILLLLSVIVFIYIIKYINSISENSSNAFIAKGKTTLEGSNVIIERGSGFDNSVLDHELIHAERKRGNLVVDVPTAAAAEYCHLSTKPLRWLNMISLRSGYEFIKHRARYSERNYDIDYEVASIIDNILIESWSNKEKYPDSYLAGAKLAGITRSITNSSEECVDFIYDLSLGLSAKVLISARYDSIWSNWVNTYKSKAPALLSTKTRKILEEYGNHGRELIAEIIHTLSLDTLMTKQDLVILIYYGAVRHNESDLNTIYRLGTSKYIAIDSNLDTLFAREYLPESNIPVSAINERIEERNLDPFFVIRNPKVAGGHMYVPKVDLSFTIKIEHPPKSSALSIGEVIDHINAVIDRLKEIQIMANGYTFMDNINITTVETRNNTVDLEKGIITIIWNYDVPCEGHSFLLFEEYGALAITGATIVLHPQLNYLPVITQLLQDPLSGLSGYLPFMSDIASIKQNPLMRESHYLEKPGYERFRFLIKPFAYNEYGDPIYMIPPPDSWMCVVVY